MARVRYGARTGAEIAATRTTKLPDVWSTGVVAVRERDPDAVAAVPPPPLKRTGRPLVRVSVSQVRLPGHPLDAGSFAVAAAHGTTEGWYPPVTPMTRERALSGGREVFGEPKKPGEVTVAREVDHVRATPARHGVAFVGVRGTADGPLPRPARRTDRYVTFLPAVDGSGFDGDPVLVHCVREERVRRLERVSGEVIPRGAAYDPVAERVDPQALLPYVHQRYDDPRQIVDAPPEGSRRGPEGGPRRRGAGRPGEGRCGPARDRRRRAPAGGRRRRPRTGRGTGRVGLRHLRRGARPAQRRRVGPGAEGRMGEHEPNDWRWAFEVDVWGVFHGVQAFLPRMPESGLPGHVVNTSSGDGGIAPLPTVSVYAVTKAAVVTPAESLYALLRAADARGRLGALPGAVHAAHGPVGVAPRPARALPPNTGRAGRPTAASASGRR